MFLFILLLCFVGSKEEVIMEKDLGIETYRVVVVYIARADIKLTVLFSHQSFGPVVKAVLGRESYLIAYDVSTPTPKEVRTNQLNLTIDDEDYRFGNEIAMNVYFMKTGEIRLVHKPKTLGLVTSPIQNIGADYMVLSSDTPEHISMRKLWAC